MDPGVIALLGGMGGAVLMLLVVLLFVLGLAMPVVRAVVRFVGNFDSLSAQRRGGRVVIAGALDDWREAEPQPEPELAGVVHAVASGDIPVGAVVALGESEPTAQAPRDFGASTVIQFHDTANGDGAERQQTLRPRRGNKAPPS